jgi:hypothetical protein
VKWRDDDMMTLLILGEANDGSGIVELIMNLHIDFANCSDDVD